MTTNGAFAQDTWKATPRLTLTYGLRWDDTEPLSIQERHWREFPFWAGVNLSSSGGQRHHDPEE